MYSCLRSSAEKQMNIFMSYTLRDRILDVPSLRRLEGCLSTFGDTYVDALQGHSRAPQSRVLEMLRNADLFVACCTPRFFASKWVRVELMHARALQIPVFAFDLRPPRPRCSSIAAPRAWNEPMRSMALPVTRRGFDESAPVISYVPENPADAPQPTKASLLRESHLAPMIAGIVSRRRTPPCDKP